MTLFGPVEDIPNIEGRGISLPKFDKEMTRMIESCSFAIRSASNLKKKSKEEREVCRLVSDHLNLFVSTHKSLRILLRRAHRQADFTIVGDAVSLGREQVEKIFILALLFDNPDRWLLMYLRNSLRGAYEEYLLRLDEYSQIPRMKTFLEKDYPRYIETLRKPPAHLRIGPAELVSEFALNVVEYRWKHPGAGKPRWMKRKGRIKDYLDKMFSFPTPGGAIRKITSKRQRLFLSRWHKEYQYLCQYSHVTLRKMMMPVMHQSNNLWIIDKTRVVVVKEMERLAFLSYTATATACALTMNNVKNTFGYDRDVKEFWQKLNEKALLPKALWKLYGKYLLK